MRELAATIAEATYALRATTAAQLVLRVATFAALAAAAVLCAVWFPFPFMPLALALLAIAGLVSVVRPESPWPAVAIGGVALWWAAGGSEAAWWRAVVVAMLLATFHIGAALCDAAPPWARSGPGARARMVRSAAQFLALSLLAALVVVAFASPDGLPFPMVWAVLGGSGLIGTGVLVGRALHR